MKNLYASVFVLAFLAACGTHSYKNTHVGTLLDAPDYTREAWLERARRGM